MIATRSHKRSAWAMTWVEKITVVPAAAKCIAGERRFELPEGGPEPLLKALLDGNAGIETLSIERPGLHDAFIAIAGAAAARDMGSATPQEQAA